MNIKNPGMNRGVWLGVIVKINFKDDGDVPLEWEVVQLYKYSRILMY